MPKIRPAKGRARKPTPKVANAAIELATEFSDGKNVGPITSAAMAEYKKKSKYSRAVPTITAAPTRRGDALAD
jgi:hypothetical protein